VFQRRADGSVEAPQLGPVEAGRRAQRVEPRAPQRFVDVDVPHPGERPLVEKRRLERRSTTRQALAEPSGGEQRIERLVADPLVDIRLGLAGLEQQPRAEAPDVPVCDIRSVV
jgi:hypothetical protein